MRSLLASGRAVVQDLEADSQEMTPVQVLIGGVDRTGTYLMTPTTYDLVCAYQHRAGQIVPSSQRALVQMFEQDGLLSVPIAMGDTNKMVVLLVSPVAPTGATPSSP